MFIKTKLGFAILMALCAIAFYILTLQFIDTLERVSNESSQSASHIVILQ